MNTIHPSTGGLKLCLHTTVNNEWSDAPGHAYLEIDATAARAILDLIGLTRVFAEQAGRAGLVCPLYAVSLGLGDGLPRFQLIEPAFAEEPDANQPVVRLPAGFDAETVDPDRDYRVECHRIEVEAERVRFTALLRKADDEFTTADLDAEMLRAIAEGRDPGLPLAELAPVETSNANLN